jgi:hypothetical protein
LSGSVGLQLVSESKELAPAVLPRAILGGSEHDRLLALPDLGELKLAETLYFQREGPRTVGLLFARDGLARTCLLTLSLERSNGDLAWLATVAGVTRDGKRSADGLGASFLFHTRQSGSPSASSATRSPPITEAPALARQTRLKSCRPS